MKEKRNILVICALGYATSTMIKKAISDYLSDKNINNWSVEAIGLSMSEGYIDSADIIVSSLDLDQSKYKVPVLNGVPLISGINKDQTLAQILEIIQKIEQV